MKKGDFFRGFSFVFVFLFIISFVVAVPQTFNVHGRLTNAGGTPIEGSNSMVFKIYDGYTGGTELWTDTLTVDTDSKGIYNVVLEAIDLNFSDQYYLGIKVGSDSEMSPRLNLTSSPYAFASESLRSDGDIEIESGSAVRLFVESSNGYIGIGTSVPQEMLHITGNVLINGTLNMDSGQINNLANGSSAQDAVTYSQLQASVGAVTESDPYWTGNYSSATGTGNVVLSTSPSLTTPTLGVASATSLAITGAGTFSNGGSGITSVSGTGLTTSGFLGSTSYLYSQSDIYTTGAGDDLWLGASSQSSANFRAYATGQLDIDADNVKAYFGEGQDASIYYDGTDMYINPKAVGSGNLDVSSAKITSLANGTAAQDAVTKSQLDAVSAADAGGTVTSVTAGNGMTQTGTSTINPTLNVVSHAGTAGSIGTINVGADAIGVNLGTTSTTAYRGDYGNTAYTDRLKWDGGSTGLTASTGRTSLGLVAGGAGDIWVEKAGDTMTGNLTIDDAAYLKGANLKIEGSTNLDLTLSGSEDYLSVGFNDVTMHSDDGSYILVSDTTIVYGAGGTIIKSGAFDDVAIYSDNKELGRFASGGDFYVDTDTLYVDNSTDRVGIGDPTPSYTLDVNGDARFTGALTLDTNGSSAQHAVTKSQLDASVGAVTESDPYWTGNYSSATGTGNVVLSTSPSLTTPTLGVASATSLAITGAGTFSNGGSGITSVSGTGLTTSGFLGSTSYLYSQSDIYTTGAGDDLWLGASSQSSANFRAYANGSVNAVDLVTTGAVTWSGGSSTNANTAYTHSQDNTQAHSDYLINNGDDTTSGTITAGGFTTSGDVAIGSATLTDTGSSLQITGDKVYSEEGFRSDRGSFTAVSGIESYDTSQENLFVGTRVTSGSARSAWIGAEFDGTGTATSLTGLNAFTYNENSGTVTTATGGLYAARNRGTGTITTAYAVKAANLNNGASGSITDSYNFYSQLANNAGTVTDHFDYYAADPSSSGTVTNQYGLYVENLTKAGTRYAIYTAGDTPSYFGGAVTLDSTLSAGATTVTTLNTGQGAYELYAMNQDVESTDAVTFAGATFNGNVNATGYNLSATRIDIENPGKPTFYFGHDSYDYPGFFSDYGDFFFGQSGDDRTYINYYTGSAVDFGWASNTQAVTIYGTLTTTDTLDAPTLNTGQGDYELYAMNQNVQTSNSPQFIGLTLTGDLAVNGDDITSDGQLDIMGTSYIRMGDTGTPGSATGDDDVYVPSDLEVDGAIYGDGTIYANSGITLGPGDNIFWNDGSGSVIMDDDEMAIAVSNYYFNSTGGGYFGFTGNEVRIGSGTPGTATGTGDLYVADALEVDGTATIGSYLELKYNGAGQSAINLTTGYLVLDGGSYVQFESPITMAGTTNNIELGSNYLSGDGDDEGILIASNGQVNINQGIQMGSGSDDQIYWSASGESVRLNRTTLELGTVDFDFDGSNGGVFSFTGNEVRIGTGTPGTATGAGDLYVEGYIETDGNIVGDGSTTISGINTISATVGNIPTLYANSFSTLYLGNNDNPVEIGTSGSAVTVKGPLTAEELTKIGSGGSAGFADGAGDLYVQNDLEVDGGVTLDYGNAIFWGTGTSISESSGDITINNDLTTTTLNTGQGAYELYAMNQDVETTDNVDFNQLDVTDYVTASGGLHVGGTSDPGTDNLVVEGKVSIGNPSYVTATGYNSLALGYYTSNGKINAAGTGSQAAGYAQSGTNTINASGAGSFAGGYVSSAGTDLVASGDGSTARGYISSYHAQFTASGDGATALGYVNGPGSISYGIIAQGDGSLAVGSVTGGSSSITASGAGSFAGGSSSTGTITASGAGSLAFGTDVTATQTNSIAFGNGFDNTAASTFMVGYSAAPELIVNTTGVTVDGTLVSTGAITGSKIASLGTTEQFRISYDATNYLKGEVSSAGYTTFTAAGSTPGIKLVGNSGNYINIDSDNNQVTLSTDEGTTVTMDVDIDLYANTNLNLASESAITFKNVGTTIGGFNSGKDFYVDTNTLFVDSSENKIGIGISAPSQKLVVNGTAGGLVVDVDSNSEPTINTTSGNVTITSAGGSVIIQLG